MLALHLFAIILRLFPSQTNEWLITLVSYRIALWYGTICADCYESDSSLWMRPRRIYWDTGSSQGILEDRTGLLGLSWQIQRHRCTVYRSRLCSSWIQLNTSNVMISLEDLYKNHHMIWLYNIFFIRTFYTKYWNNLFLGNMPFIIYNTSLIFKILYMHLGKQPPFSLNSWYIIYNKHSGCACSTNVKKPILEHPALYGKGWWYIMCVWFDRV